MTTETNWGTLMQQPKVKSARRILSSVWSFVVIFGCVLWGGASMGYWLGVNDERERSLEEVARLQLAYGTRLGTISEKAADAASTAQEAAATVDKIAEKVSKAARINTPPAQPASGNVNSSNNKER